MRPVREPLLRERDMRDRERLIPEGLIQQHERERDRERDRGERGERERMMMDLPPHPDPRAPGRMDVRGDARGEVTRQDRSSYEPPLPKEALSPAAPEKSSNSHHGQGDHREPEKTESVDGKR